MLIIILVHGNQYSCVFGTLKKTRVKKKKSVISIIIYKTWQVRKIVQPSNKWAEQKINKIGANSFGKYTKCFIKTNIPVRLIFLISLVTDLHHFSQSCLLAWSPFNSSIFSQMYFHSQFKVAFHGCYLT